MIRMHWKIQLILLLISLFFVGLGMESIVDEKKSGYLLLRQLFHMIPFMTSSVIFIRNIYYQRKKKRIKKLILKFNFFGCLYNIKYNCKNSFVTF